MTPWQYILLGYAALTLIAWIADIVDLALGEIEMFTPEFEEIAGISKSQVHEKGKPIAAADRFMDEDAEIPDRIKQVIETMYA